MVAVNPRDDGHMKRQRNEELCSSIFKLFAVAGIFLVVAVKSAGTQRVIQKLATRRKVVSSHCLY